jgi:lipopolysaccharide cholinephosphotransferase
LHSTIRRLQLIKLEILDRFVRICDEHSLRYFLAYGTLIGAIRHKGFIPWDDDTDVGMPREDYEKFIALCKNGQVDNFFLQEGRTYSKYWHIYAKFRKNNTQKIEANPPPFYQDEHRGINIDIFPYDDVSANDCIKKIQDFFIIKIKFLLFEKRGYKSKSSPAAALVKRLLAALLPFRFLHSLSRFIMQFKTGKCTGITSWRGTDGHKKETFPREVLFPLKKTEFEGRHFFVPGNSDAYLSQIYGSYMQPPPEGQRNVYAPAVIFDVEKNERVVFDE